MVMYKRTYYSSKILLLPSLIIIISLIMSDLIFYSDNSLKDQSFSSNPRRLIIFGLAYLIALFNIDSKKQFSIRLIKKNTTYLCFIFFSFFSLYWSSYSVNVVINTGHYTGFLFVIISACNYYRFNQSDIFRTFAIAIGMGLLISIGVSVLVPEIGIHSITGRWQGVAGNPNTLGLICIVSVWANTSDYFARRNNRKGWLNILLIMITIIALVGANSTTSFIVALFSFAGVWYLSSLETKASDARFIRFMLLFFISSMFTLVVLLMKPELLSIKGIFALAGKDTTFTGRTDIWTLAIKAINLKQYCGWSFDSNRSVLDFLGLHRGQFHNGYLDLLVRGGYVSLAIFLLITAQLLYRITLLSKFNYRHSVAWFILLICILIHNITESSIMRETHLLWYLFVFMLFMMPTYLSKR